MEGEGRVGERRVVQTIGHAASSFRYLKYTLKTLNGQNVEQANKTIHHGDTEYTEEHGGGMKRGERMI